jgi:hypothetical protein
MAPTQFARGVVGHLDHYVYLLIDPTKNNEIFYVGEGTGSRCFSHLAEADKRTDEAVLNKEKVSEKVRRIKAIGSDRVRIDILRHGLTQTEALRLESAAIDLLGLPQLANIDSGPGSRSLGRMSLQQINVLYGAKPVEIAANHRVVLITINRNFRPNMSDKDLFTATREWWRIASYRRNLDDDHAPRWAMAVYAGVVYAVYWIDGWRKPTAAEIAQDPKIEGRWAFDGARDQAMQQRYLHRDVSEYLRSPKTGNRTQNPLRYVHCG